MQFIYSRQFKKQFLRLPAKIQNTAKERLKLFSQNQYHSFLNNHHLSGKYEDYKSINITGDYRVIFQKMNDELYYLIAIGTHDQLYNK